jgi:hypothetical protein
MGPGTVQQVAALLRLHEAPHYFRRGGKGRYRKAPAEIVQQALLAIEKKKQVQAQIEAWSAELMAGACPAPIREQLYKILFRPTKTPRVQSRGGGQQGQPDGASGLVAKGRRHCVGLGFSLAALLV